MVSALQCQLAGCGRDAVGLAPHHDPFAKVLFERLIDPPMTATCQEHADLMWTFYGKRAVLAVIQARLRQVPLSVSQISGIAWMLNSHSNATSKSVAALLSTLGQGSP
ncbi:hypothetical protein J2T11_003223 [Paenarthrobacter nicotinovorans]|nr:hypothetical protein [Paenarthrobacter nicotinovorans]